MEKNETDSSWFDVKANDSEGITLNNSNTRYSHTTPGRNEKLGLKMNKN